LNFDRVQKNEELYDREQQVARSLQAIEENSQERHASARNVSVENNLPGVSADMMGDQGPTAQTDRVEEITNYDISKSVRSIVREGGEIKRLSVAVLLDGTYTTNEAGEKVYTPRTDAELDKIGALVRSAVGLDSSRGGTLEVVHMPFAAIDTEEDIPDNAL